MTDLKTMVRDYWDASPCGTHFNEMENTGLSETILDELSVDYFDAIADDRKKLEPFIESYAEPWLWIQEKVLEVGCGVGSDTVMFAKRRANITAIDLSPHSVAFAKQNIALHNLKADILVADAEQLPFPDETFDLVYSWGVLHHTPDIRKALGEIYRVLKPGGQICIMLYNKWSLVSVQMYLMFGLFKKQPFISLDELYSKYHESPGTKVFSKKEIKSLFDGWGHYWITTQQTPYDLRYGRNRYFPRKIWGIVPSQLGFFHIIKAEKI
jgi:ubiquinone/menaquinone biosynthesis C-methylase UbiE